MMPYMGFAISDSTVDEIGSRSKHERGLCIECSKCYGFPLILISPVQACIEEISDTPSMCLLFWL